ncbi:MAG TPA: amidohydrolase family protein, partial [Mycobacteriales bacterium]|nr:amidohydrolase family protein [Mycobacteriales bacterium]
MRDASDDPGLPIKLGPCANDEYQPVPLTPVVAAAVRRARDDCDRAARRLGMNRREFLLSTCGAATTLLALNACTEDAAPPGAKPGGSYAIPTTATTEPEVAESVLGGEEFVFDVQGHLLDFTLDPRAREAPLFAANLPQARCGEHDAGDCFSIEKFLEEVFLRSDTSMIALSAIPVPHEHDPLSIDVMAETRRVLGALCHDDDRLLLHAKVLPTNGSLAGALAGMREVAAKHPVAAWKMYTHLPGPGWWLDDHEPGAPVVGDAVIRQAVELGIPRIAVHKGLAGGRYASPVDIGPAAKRHPDIEFLVYHSGYQIGTTEGAYTTATRNRGTTRLVSSVLDAGVAPNSNVYAELGSTWWQVMRHPTEAAHFLGKMLKYLGVDNVLWGTDSIFYGSPQDQIQAFRSFQIRPELQERYGYPALTPEVKAKVLGRNGARVYGVEPVARRCEFT